MRVTVLGAIGARTPEGAAVELGSRSQRLVLAVLAAHRGSVVRDDVLVDALWEEPPPTATRTLRSLVSRLRRSLGDAVRRRGDGYVLDVDPASIDAGRFDELVGRAAGLAPPDAERVLGEALALWWGAAYGEFADLEAIRAEATRLEQRRRAARVARAEALLAAGRPAEAGELASALVAEEALDEASWAVLVRARAAGAPGEALRIHQQAVAALAEVGLEPSPALRAAEAEALAGGGGAPTTTTPNASTPGASPSVPASGVKATGDAARPRPPRTSLVGRRTDLAGVGELLERSRLVTLVGPGGVGKTRLAVEVAVAMADRHALGARVVSLGAVESADEVIPAVAEGLGLLADGDLAGALDRAGSLDVLAVLDNCEHVIDAVAGAVDRLLDGGSAVRVLATSREPLGVVGEHRWPLGPLDLEVEAVHLFIDRARAVRPDLEVDDETEAAIAGIVARLDGLPLAIEMAAAMAATVGLDEVAALVVDPAGTLRSPTRQGPARHRTLQAVVDWSLARCSAEEQTVFAELGVFEASFSTDDAVAVVATADVRETVRSLADRSLVDVVPGAQARYRMLETVRRHARSRLGEGAAVHHRHAEHHLGRLIDADWRLRGADEAAAHTVIEVAWPELRGAHRWAVAADPALAEELSRRLHTWAVSRQRVDAFRWADRLIGADGHGPSVALTARAQGAIGAGRVPDALAAAEAACAIGMGVDRLHALEALGDASLFQGALDDAASCSVEMRQAADDLGDPHYVVVGACNLSLARTYAGRLDDALAAVDLGATRIAAPTDRGWIDYAIGEALLDREPVVAADHLRRAVALADSVGNLLLGGVARVSLVSQEARVGEPASAAATFVEVIEHWQRHGSVTHLGTTLRNLVVLLVRMDELVAAARLAGAVAAQVGKPTFGAEAARLDGARATLVERLGPTEARHRAAGEQLRLDEAVAEARAVLVAEPGPSGRGGARRG